MNLLFLVDQKKALEMGINAPQSTVMLDIDPATLSQEHRDIIASVLCDGHDCTQYSTIILISPTAKGLISALDQVALARREEQEKNERKRSEKRKEQEEAIARALEGYVECECTIAMDKDGQIVTPGSCHAKFKTTVVVRNLPHFDIAYASESMQKSYRDAHTAAEKAAIDIALPALEKIRQESITAEEQEAARVKSEYDSLYARLPQALRDRHAAKFASEVEVVSEIRKIARKDAGFSKKVGWEEKSKIEYLTDAQFAKYQKISARIPNGAMIEAVCLFDKSYRPVEDDDDPNDIDDDGVILEMHVKGNYALITWYVGGIKVQATEPLDSQPAE